MSPADQSLAAGLTERGIAFVCCLCHLSLSAVCVPPVQGRCLSAGDENAAQDVLELLIEVAEGYPRFLRKHLQEMVSAMMQVGRRRGGGYVFKL
jgi:hypothetical protein